MWASGDYPSMVETFLLPLGPRLVQACGIGPGMSVLDVAAGTGNAAIPAAQTGAEVTASDLTPEIMEAGRHHAEAEGLALEWVEADAEHLPFEDASFDVVMSSIGAIFAPHHQEVADELVRVCRPGGTIGLLSWAPEGMIGALFRTMGPFAPPPPPGAQSPPLWGSEEHIADLFGARVDWRSRPSSIHVTTASTSRRATARRSPPKRTRAGPSARRSSTRRSTSSAMSGIAARPTKRASRRSTCSRLARGRDDAVARQRAGGPPMGPVVTAALPAMR
jgi:SAM-dependent methyltransferase